jgi:outer membrane protein OmpA-like peptidoglycan-associated protein
LIEGYTDSNGSKKLNSKLSSKRAWKVYSYLVKQGKIPVNRFKVKGRGSDKPVASNKTAKGKARNRRVEITILK